MPSSGVFSSLSERTRKTWAYAIACVCGLMLVFVLLFTSLKLAVSNENWVRAQYEAYGLADELDMTNEDMTAAFMRMVDYMNGTVGSIQITVTVAGEEVEFYNEREMEHMLDVRRLWQLGENLRMVFLLICGVCFVFIFLLVYTEAWFVFARGILFSSAGLAVIAGIAYLFIAGNFSVFWVKFHELFFTNDLWLLNPAVDRMIWICPEFLFSEIITRAILMFLFPLFVILVDAGVIWYIRYQRKKNGY